MTTNRTVLNAASALAVAFTLTAAAQAEEIFYGTDAAASWLARPGSFKMAETNRDTYAYVADKIVDSGFRHVRERLSWNEVNPAPGKWNYSHYLHVAKTFRDRGVRISGMFHDAPKWMETRGKLPVDLKNVYEFCRRTGETFGDMMGDWEFWNEEDIGFSPAAAWDYAAAAKAAYLGFKAASATRPAMMGALCHANPTAYGHTLFQNDLALYTDAFNFHTYAALTAYRTIFDDLHAFMATYGMKDLAVWMTETGTHQEGVCAKDGVMAGFRKHSPAQEILHAEIAAKSMFALQMHGVSRDYFFCFPPYNEMGGNKDWGVMRRDGTLKPAAEMFAAMNAALAGCPIVGTVETGCPDVLAYAFRQPDARHTLAYIASGPTDRQGTGAEKDIARAVPFRFLGRHLVACCYPQYLKDLPALPIARAATPRGRLGAPLPAANEDRTVVLQVATDPQELVLGGGKSMLEITRTNATLRLTVYNFEGVEKAGSLTCSVGGRVSGLPERIVLPAWGRADFTLRYTANFKEARERVGFGGAFNGKRISALSMNFFNMDALRRNRRQIAIDLADDSRWVRNDSADKFETRFEKEGAERLFHYVWTRDEDRWVYPKFRLAKDELKDALLIEFEIRSEQDKVENDFVTSLAMLFGKNGFGRHLAYQPPNGAWESRRIDLSTEKDLEKAEFLSIGMNPKGRNLTYHLRNVRIYKK